MTVNVDDNLVRPIVEAEIKAAIIREFDKTPAIISKVVSEIINQQVDDSGKPSRYSSDLKYIQWLTREAVRDATKAALTEWVLGNKKELQEEIERQIIKNKKNIAAQLMAGMAKATESSWKIKVDVILPSE